MREKWSEIMSKIIIFDDLHAVDFCYCNGWKIMREDKFWLLISMRMQGQECYWP